ncbi:MAG TPA: preprotein translocase subunit SecE [Bacteroidota bacterium]|nr:preprotein translocase subunit SecE [Bacteroidota bacterium]
MKEKIIAFFTDVSKEMKKVTWPRRAELQESTLIVLIVCGVIALFVYGVDIFVSNLLKFVQ